MNTRKTGARGRPAAKKTTAKKPASRKPAAKAAAKKPAAKATARKPAARKPAAKAASRKPAVKRTSTRANANQSRALTRTNNSSFRRDAFNSGFTDAQHEGFDSGLDPRRPPDNVMPPYSVLSDVMDDLESARHLLENYAQHLRPLDRRRLNGVGIKKTGFIESVYDVSVKNQEFFPHYLTMQKFSFDNSRFSTMKTLMSLAKQVDELLWNITMESADILYTDALEYYASVRESAKRRIDAAEALFNELREYFKSRGVRPEIEEDKPTNMELRRDFDAILHGRRDGEVIVRNVKPKITAGKREVVDKKFTESEQFKETQEGEIKE
jgi:hypothetical protein